MLSTPLLAAYSLGLTGASFGFWGNLGRQGRHLALPSSHVGQVAI